MQETIRKFKEILAKLNAYQHALGVLQYDSETAMPRAGAAGYAAAMGALSEEVYKLQTSDAFKGAVRELLSRKAELDEITRREAEVLGEEMARMDCVPVPGVRRVPDGAGPGLQRLAGGQAEERLRPLCAAPAKAPGQHAPLCALLRAGPRSVRRPVGRV